MGARHHFQLPSEVPVKILARCKHCSQQHTWERLPDGSYVAPYMGADRRFVFVCFVNPSKVCEPHVETRDQRMVRELGQAASKRFASGGFRGGKRR